MRQKTVCKICGFEGANIGRHLQCHHSEISTIEYYNLYYKKNSEGICTICGKPTEFICFRDGYRKTCGTTECRYNSTKVAWKKKSELDLLKIQIKTKNTTKERYGVERYVQTDESKRRFKNTSLEKYGCENPFQNEEIKNKIKETNLEKYGFVSYVQTEEYKERYKNFCLENYGCINTFQNEEIKNKIKETSLERYGFERYGDTKEFKDKVSATWSNKNEDALEKIDILRKGTCLEKYGIDHYNKTQDFKDRISLIYENRTLEDTQKTTLKREKTCLEKYGVNNAMQNEEIFNKNQKTRFCWKPYILPSGKEIKLQGYENKYLDEYFSNGGDESDIIIHPKESDLGFIVYTDKDKNHRYYPDFYIKSINKIIEVKSTWTMKKDLEKNLLKESKCKEMGFEFEFKIYKNNKK